MGLRRQKKVSSALLSLSRSVQELTEENQSLKEDLDRVLSNSPTVSTMKGTIPGVARGGMLEERPRLMFFEGRCRQRLWESPGPPAQPLRPDFSCHKCRHILLVYAKMYPKI